MSRRVDTECTVLQTSPQPSNTVPPAGTLQEALRLILTACSCATIHSDYFREEYYVIGLCNGEALCFLCDGN